MLARVLIKGPLHRRVRRHANQVGAVLGCLLLSPRFTLRAARFWLVHRCLDGKKVVLAATPAGHVISCSEGHVEWA